MTRHFLIFILAVCAAAVSAQTTASAPDTLIQVSGAIAKTDTVKVKISVPVEIEGHYFNVANDEACALTLYVTVAGNWIQDCAGNRYAILPDNHRGCPVIHAVLDKKKELKQ